MFRLVQTLLLTLAVNASQAGVLTPAQAIFAGGIAATAGDQHFALASVDLIGQARAPVDRDDSSVAQPATKLFAVTRAALPGLGYSGQPRRSAERASIRAPPALSA